MFACPNCGGNLKFDIPSQQLACEFCLDKFDPYCFDNRDRDAQEQKNEFEATIFTCPQCGGEILSTDNAAAGFCSFCGASAILFSRISQEKRPDYIIPFQKTKEDCKQAYSELMKHAIFAPKEFKDPEHIDGFRGIYMPYWAYYITQTGSFQLKGEKSCRRGDYIITDHYDLTGEINSYYKGLSYDASSSFYDNISKTIAPYNVKGMKAFTPAYFCGFYADTPDVPSEVYKQQAEETAFTESYKKLGQAAPFSKYSITSEVNPSTLHTQTKKVDSTMFPVWFLSYRNGDRVAYAAVNGQTGKAVTDLPVDKRKYLLGSLLLALPIFLLLNFILTMIPSSLLTLTAGLALIVCILYTAELRRLSRQENLEDDKGYLFVHHPEKVHAAESQNRTGKTNQKKTKTIGISIFAVYLFLSLGFFMIPVLMETIRFRFLWLIIVIAYTVISALGFAGCADVPKGHRHFTGFLCLLCAVAAGAVITLLNPVSDLYYYAGVILILGTVFLTINDIMSYYNLLSTRRLPQFDKEGGNDHAS